MKLGTDWYALSDGAMICTGVEVAAVSFSGLLYSTAKPCKNADVIVLGISPYEYGTLESL